MRERITSPVSKFFNEEVIMPETIKDFESNIKEALSTQRAYAIMLTETGIVDKASGKAILEGLEYVEHTLNSNNLKGELEDLFYNIETTMIEKTGLQIGGKLHTGRSRNDIGSTLNRLELRRSLVIIFDYLIKLQSVLLEKAEKEKDIVITGYTHTQPAQPITMGYYYSAVLEALERDFTRLQAAYINTNRCPYGAAAFAGASFPLDREMLAKLLGFDEVLENALDCIASKDFLLETEMAFSNLAVTLSRVAQDLYMWSTDEFGLLDVGGEVAVCSSIMPQKKNPAGLEYVKAKAAHPIGALMGCLASLKNIPFSNNIDIHEALWFFEESFNETRKVIGMMTECLKYSKINEDTAYNRAASNYSTVTGLADTLVKRCGLSFREAHHIVGSMVLETIESKQGIAGMNGALLSEISREFLGREICLSDEEIKNVLEPRNNIESKETFGGPQQASVNKMLLRSADKLNDEKAWYGVVVQRLKSASALMREKEAAIRNN